ncbi:MAG TPA: Pycsar system effector family protein [Thermoanaerobaculia bacterium]|nr:Pycsar system effector family protein [Thermoanaerobaculia bacterium]
MIGDETIRHVEAKPRHFKDVRARQSVDVLLRTAQQQHMQLSMMADTKASILITVSSIVLTIALSRAGDPQLRAALLTLAFACLLSLVLAIIAVLPAFSKKKGKRNFLFFGHFADMTEDEFMYAMEQILATDEGVYEAAVRDLHSLGVYLYRKKYRYLRYAYVALLTGFILATIVEVYVLTFM